MEILEVTMATTELRRTPASQMPPSEDLISVLALKAESILGYRGLRERLGIAPASLTRVLEELEIEPYHPEGVSRYKAEKVRQVEQQLWDELRQQILEDLQERGVIAEGTFVRARWRMVPLRKFQGEVPEFALARAIQIKERLPKAEFYVDELKAEKRYDPFLVVSCGRERFYIDVWDERDFEASNG
jgi:hypothetical protein